MQQKKNKKKRSADFCLDRIDVITNFAVITNMVIKRVLCTMTERAYKIMTRVTSLKNKD